MLSSFVFSVSFTNATRASAASLGTKDSSLASFTGRLNLSLSFAIFAAALSTLSDDELKAFKPGESSYENWKKSFDASAQTVYTSPEKGFFGQDKLSPSDPNYKITGDVAFENVGSRYSHQVPIKDKKGNIIRYSREEGTKLGTTSW